jgi:DNA-binding PadR family transcriptional regulator
MYKEMREQTYLVLTALAGGPRHGYALIKDVDQLSGGRMVLRAGSLYAMVDRLVGEGLVVAAGEEIVDGRLRRYYALSEAGGEELRAAAQRMATAARTALRRLDAVSPRLAIPSGLSYGTA